VASCGSSTLSLDDYSTSCSDDGECVGVYIGDVCPCAGCDNAAINGTDLPQYRTDYGDARDSCNDDVQCDMVPCWGGRAYCEAGQCAYDAWTSYDGGTGGSGDGG
jgi:hypothetical protein